MLITVDKGCIIKKIQENLGIKDNQKFLLVNGNDSQYIEGFFHFESKGESGSELYLEDDNYTSRDTISRLINQQVKVLIPDYVPKEGDTVYYVKNEKLKEEIFYNTSTCRNTLIRNKIFKTKASVEKELRRIKSSYITIPDSTSIKDSLATLELLVGKGIFVEHFNSDKPLIVEKDLRGRVVLKDILRSEQQGILTEILTGMTSFRLEDCGKIEIVSSDKPKAKTTRKKKTKEVL